MSINLGILPMPRLQFFDLNGVPLAGGKIYTYAAGTTTPLATYQDAQMVAANTNPITLDAGGFATIFLTAANYKILAKDSALVEQWSIDNVSTVSLAQMQENNSFASISVSGNATIGGDVTVGGVITAASADITGALTVEGALSTATAEVSGNATIDGTLTVDGATELADATIDGTLAVTGEADLNGAVKIGALSLSDYILAQIPALAALTGTLIIPDISTSGNWVIFTFGGTVGSRIRVALGCASGATNGSAITLPSGFNTTNLKAVAMPGAVATTAGNQLDQFSASITAGVITVTASDNSGHNFTPTAAWVGFAWITDF
jgi:cytoskeletal protein CcmA (bactofilin family)